jgi:hypothetical protein
MMKALLLILALLGSTGCAVTPQSPEPWMARERNACLPTAIAMSQGLKRQGITAKVVRYSYRLQGRLLGHAITAYLYPPGANTLYTYDYEGSWRTRAFWGDDAGIARAAESLRGRNNPILSSEEL